jgi:hypothetical protein
MASRIAVLNHYRPRIKFGRTVQRRELVEYIAQGTGLNEGEVILVLMELRDAIVHYNSYGRGVKLEGLGTYLPNINFQGVYDVAHRLDKDLKRGLNSATGHPDLINRKYIGKTSNELVALWNAAHPDDPVG